VVQGGTQRVSFLVGPNGRIAHVWPQVSPAKHAAEVLEEVRRRTAPEAAAG
jgi:peroxiredoxin